VRAGLSRIFGYGSFDKGMCAFLECVRALQGKLICSHARERLFPALADVPTPPCLPSTRCRV